MPDRILLDTNSYLRLAYVLNPLLKRPFGKYELYVLPTLYKELSRNPRLRNDFPWVNEADFINNRKKSRFRLSDRQKGEINKALDFMMNTAVLIGNTASPVDIHCLAYGYVLNHPVVTDDSDMILLGNEYGVNCLRSLELLNLLYLEKAISLKQIRDIIKYWNYVNDFPSNWIEDYRRLFNEDPYKYI